MRGDGSSYSHARNVGELTDILSGFAFKSDLFTNDPNLGMPLIRIRDLKSSETACRYIGEYDPAYVIKKGDILVGMDGDFTAVRWNGKDALLNQRVLRLKSSRPEILDEEYLFYRVQPELARLEKSITGTTVKHLSAKDIKRLLWELPPVGEQRRIAGILKSVDKSLECATRARVQLDRVRAAFVAEAFGEVGLPHLPTLLSEKGWRRVRLGEIFRERKGSGQPGLPVASISIEWGLVLRSSLDRRVQSALTEEAHSLVKRGDIAYNMMRMWQGACGLATEDCCVSPAYVVMTPGPCLTPEFALLMLRSAPLVRLLRAYSQGIVDDRLRLYPDAFYQIPANLPPLAVQGEIVERFSQLDASLELARQAEARLAMT